MGARRAGSVIKCANHTPFMSDKPILVARESLTIDAVRAISDLRIMHSKVDELYEVVKALRERHDQVAIISYAERELLEQDIARVDEIYLFFIALKEKLRG